MSGPASVEPSASPALRALLAGIVDYAGLFPPSSLTMAEAVENFATYLASAESWALGRFVVPVSGLDDFERHASPLLPRTAGAAPWRLSALVGATLEADLDRVRRFNEMHGVPAGTGAATIDAVELRAAGAAEIERALGAVPRSIETFVEIPLGGDVDALVAAIGKGGGRAKARTGGTTADAFPTTRDIARFLEACVREGVPFKATAGLHHPLRAEYRLTYEPDAPTGVMYGFLNVFLGAALLATGMPPAELPALLEEASPDALRVDDAGISWRRYCLTREQAAAARASLALSFGSCSFREPIDDLKGLRLL